jgi:hypothetical protein
MEGSWDNMEIVQLFGVRRAKSVHRKKALEQRRERGASGLALVRYIQLNRHCSEEAGYQRLTTFVKKHIPLDDSSSLERMVADDRQSLLVIAQDLLVHDPHAIDKI